MCERKCLQDGSVMFLKGIGWVRGFAVMYSF